MKKTQTSAEKIKKAYDKAVGSDPCPLDAREMDILERYYAFNGHSRHTLEEIAATQKPPVTRERIRQIKHYALRKIGAASN